MTSTPSTEPEGWRIGGQLPAALTPTVVLAGSDGSGLVCGWWGSLAGPLAERRLRVHRVSASGAAEQVLDDDGWVAAGHRRGDRVALLQVRPGPTWFLRLSDDGGWTWTEAQATAAASLSHVHLLDGGEVWGLGARVLGRWTPTGWEEIDVPVDQLDPHRHRLAGAGSTPVLLGPHGLLLWREATRTWASRRAGGAHVRALSGSYVAARGSQGAVRLGRLSEAWVEWLGAVEGGADVAAMVQAPWSTSGPLALQLLLVPGDPTRTPGLVLVRSLPEGGLAVERLKLPSSPGWVGISGPRGVLAVTLDRRLLQSGGPS